MNKMIAKRQMRYAGRALKAGDSFDASPKDAEYYLRYGHAEMASGGVDESETSRREYGRKDMQAEDMRGAAMTAQPVATTPDAQNEAQAREAALAQTAGRRGRRPSQPLTSQSALGTVQPTPGDFASVTDVPPAVEPTPDPVVQTLDQEQPVPVGQPAVQGNPVVSDQGVTPDSVQTPESQHQQPAASGGGEQGVMSYRGRAAGSSGNG